MHGLYHDARIHGRQVSHFFISYDRSLGVPARILVTIPTELSQQVPLKRWHVSTTHRISRLAVRTPELT